MNKNDILTLSAIDYTSEAYGVCKSDGFVVFVKNMMIDETAEVLIMKVLAHQAYGRIHKLIKEHPERVTERCPIAKQCGGCQIQHMSYAHQGVFKTKLVETQFKRVLNYTQAIEPIIMMEDPWFYRNKSQVPFTIHDTQLSYGFFRAHSHDILTMRECFIQSEDSNHILKSIQAFYHKQQRLPTELRGVLIKKGFNSQELMLVLVSKHNTVLYQDALKEVLMAQYPMIKVILVNHNTREDNVLLSDTYYALTDQVSIQDTLERYTFVISAASFYQVNPVSAVKLYDKAMEYAAIKKTETVLDLYCGIGTLTLFASQYAKTVIGGEINAEAIKDANENAVLNNIENVEWMHEDAQSITQSLIKAKRKIDVLIVDPPRKGLDDLTKASILQLKPKRIIYISCDPATLVRDLKVLVEHYDINKVCPVDMFPHTIHVETVVLLTRVNK
ncbi:MAG: 23S rRNA (uracil(1939)-C(5))-methyltransferase RlmD [Erysipelotrichaceae bacterium]